MKLYYFNPNNWGAQYFVMAENKIEAHEYLLQYFEKLIDDPEEKTYRHIHKAELKIWKKVNPEDSNTFPNDYKLDEFEKGQIIVSENS